MGWTLTKDLSSNMVSRLNQDMGEPWTSSTFKGGDGGRELEVPPVTIQSQDTMVPRCHGFGDGWTSVDQLLISYLGFSRVPGFWRKWPYGLWAHRPPCCCSLSSPPVPCLPMSPVSWHQVRDLNGDGYVDNPMGTVLSGPQDGRSLAEKMAEKMAEFQWSHQVPGQSFG